MAAMNSGSWVVLDEQNGGYRVVYRRAADGAKEDCGVAYATLDEVAAWCARHAIPGDIVLLPNLDFFFVSAAGRS